MTRYAIDIDRITVQGGVNVSRHELDRLVTVAVQQALAQTALPAGRTMHASVELRSRALGDTPSVAREIGRAVAHAARRGTRHG